MSDIREAFEAWYNEEYVRPILPADRTEGGYQHPDAQAACDAWQAALSANGGEADWRSGYPIYDTDGGICHIPLKGYPDHMVVAFNNNGKLVDGCGDDIGCELGDVERWKPIRFEPTASSGSQAVMGARDALREAAKQFRCTDDAGHSSVCDRHADELDAMLTHPAPPSVEVPEGWKLVPVEPTDEMVRKSNWSGNGDVSVNEDWARKTVWDRMIYAAPPPDHSGDANKMVAGHIPDAGKMDDMGGWTGSITRSQAIKILDRVTDKDDPHWEFVVEDFYDEASDTMPTIFHVFAAIGVTEEEYRKATGAENIDWPATDPSVPENEIKARALEEYADQLDAVFANAQEAGATDCPAWHAGQFAKDARKQATRLRTAGDDGEE